MKEIHDLSAQLISIVNAMNPNEPPLRIDAQLPPPTSTQLLLLRQIIAAGLIDQVECDHAFDHIASSLIRAVQIARNTPNHPQNPNQRIPHQYSTALSNTPCFIHPTSFLYDEMPEWVAYREVRPFAIPGKFFEFSGACNSCGRE
jgi:ATP-dependent RNA helicase DHX37/DHR1